MPTPQPANGKTVQAVWPQITRVIHCDTLDLVTAAQDAAVAIPQKKSGPTWPTGNILYRKLILRIYGNMNIAVGAGNALTAASNLAAKLCQAIFLRFTNLGYVVNGVDGMTLYRMLTRKLRRQFYTRDLAGVAAGANNAADPFEVILEIPFENPYAIRPQDTGIDMLMAGVPEFYVNFVAPSVLASIGGAGNTLQLNELHIDISVEAVENPNPAVGLPLHKPFYDSKTYPITATGKAIQFALPFNDRIYNGILVAQRDGTSLAELDDTIVGVADADQVSLKLNQDYIWSQQRWLTELRRQASEYGTAVLGVGQIVLDFARRVTHGSRVTDGIDVETNIPGTLTFEADVTKAAGNPYLYLGFDSVMSLSPTQMRPASLR